MKLFILYYNKESIENLQLGGLCLSTPNSNYNMQSRGYKTKGNSYKDRYISYKVCPECSGTSVYMDEWNTIVSYKCLRRCCRHQWVEDKNRKEEERPEDYKTKYEQVKIDMEEKKKQEHQSFINHYLMTVELDKIEKEELITYSLVGYKEDGKTVTLSQHAEFEDIAHIIQKEQANFKNFDVIEEKMIGNMPSELYIVANAESHLEESKELFYRPAHLGETFVFAGNFIGLDNFSTFMKYLLSLKEKRPCIFIRGANEHNILEYIHGTKKYIGSQLSVEELLQSIKKDLNYDLKKLPEKSPEIYELIKNSKDYFENDTHIVVSGGVDLSIPFWRQSNKEHLYKTTDDFIDNYNYTGKTIVFGDRDIELLNENNSHGLWYNRHKSKVGINGNVSAGKKLIALSILENQMNFLSAKNKEARAARLKEKYPDIELDDLF